MSNYNPLPSSPAYPPTSSFSLTISHINLLIWKNYLIKTRSLKSTLLEFIIPLLAVCILLVIRVITHVQSVESSLNVEDAISVEETIVYPFVSLICGGVLSTQFNSEVQVPYNRVGFVNKVQNNNFIDLYKRKLKNSFLDSAYINQTVLNRVGLVCPGANGNNPFFVNNNVISDFINYNMTMDFDSEKDMIHYVKSSQYGQNPENPGLLLGFVLNSAGPNWDYTIHTNWSALTDVRIPVNPLTINLDKNSWGNFFIHGFSTFQHIADSLILEESRVTNYTNPSFVPFPLKSHMVDTFASTVGNIFGLLFLFAYLWPFSRMVRNMVEEKELKIKEGLKMMGLKPIAFWASWLFTYGVIFFINVVIFVALLKINVFPLTNSIILFITFFLFALNLLILACICSTIFSSAKVAGTASPFVLFVAFLPYFAVSGPTKSASIKLFFSILSPVSFSLITSTLIDYESSFQGVTFENISDLHNNVSISSLLIIMFFDTLFYIFLAWYTDKVWPSEYGVHEKVWFLFSSEYWLGTQKGHIEGDDDYIENPKLFQPDLSLPVGISIQGLNKEFDSDAGIFTAVKSLYLEMYESQVFCLLGHNGAGKSTVMNMLTGLFGPTKGTAKLYDKDIVSGMDEVRKSLGICPQHDILFDNLTVYEHLCLYGSLKGIAIDALETSVALAIKEVSLSEKRDSESSTLSGGQKRRLSLAIAFIGNSKVVLLDEPTSGVDPFSRRKIWDLITLKKKSRTVILTTHFMDEADQLGDRIGILHGGKLKCCGTSLFLKGRFGVGYTLTFIKSSHATSTCVSNLSAFLKNYLPETPSPACAGSEIIYRLPLFYSTYFPRLLKDMQAKLNELTLENYGLSVTTLEDIFLGVAVEAALPAIPSGSTPITVHGTLNPPNLSKPSRSLLSDELGNERDLISLLDAREESTLWTQFVALFVKRFLNSKRDFKGLILQLILPILILSIGLSLLKIPIDSNFGQLTISPGVYNSPLILPVNSYDVNNATIPSANSVNRIFDAPSVYSNFGKDNLNFEIFGYKQLTPLNFSTALLNTMDSMTSNRYGALFFGNNSLTGNIDLRYIYTNITACFGIPTFMNLGNNALLRTREIQSSIKMNIVPMPLTTQEIGIVEQVNGIFNSIIIALAYSFIPSAYCVFIVRETEFKSKHLQLISGVKPIAYMLSNFIFDFCSYLLPMSVGLLLIYLFGSTAFNGDNFATVALAFVLYGLSVIPFTYCFAPFFTSHSTAQNVMIMIYLFSGVFLSLIGFALSAIDTTKVFFDNFLVYVFRLFPNYCLADIIFNLSLRKFSDLSQWDMKVSGSNLIFMLFEVFVYGLVAFLMDTYPNLSKMLQADPIVSDKFVPEDEDVRAERLKMMNGSDKGMIQIHGLRKTYPNKVAVKDLWFSIPRNECFGFLGVNGAGKSTTLKILTGDESPSSGELFLGGMPIGDDSVKRIMGYCPQFDALFDSLTGLEHLMFYGRIRGVPESNLEQMARRLMDKLTLTEFGDRVASTYSGGNKRKLSVAIALIGNPPVVFLDEPSTGVDPVSRRAMWDFIQETMKSRAVILTTHNMEEAEALCQRIGILVLGQLMCLGSSQHLKSRFGKGLQLDICTSTDIADNGVNLNPVDSVVDFIETEFKGKIIESYNNRIKFSIPASSNDTLVSVFSSIESNKGKLNITDYSVGQASLEQIFISFAKQGDMETVLNKENEQLETVVIDDGGSYGPLN